MFKVKQNNSPTVLSNLFLESKNVHDYYTRQADQFNVPVDERNYLQKIIRYKGVCIWNYLSQFVDNDRSFLSYKIAIRDHVVSDDAISVKF